MKRIACFVLLAAACGTDERPGPEEEEVVEPDPLTVTAAAAAGSLDDLHERIIAKRCSGQPGLCHNGQFEPNLSTPALTYAYIVNRPGIEKPALLRVKPGSPDTSLFIDKIRNRNGVATQMPLGAEPMVEAEIQELEKWIRDGALRGPGAAPVPTLNNPPKRPQIGIYTSTGTRLDGAGPVSVNAGTTLVLRHTVHDFETADASIPFAAFILSVGGGMNVVVETIGDSPHVGPSTYDAAGPPAQGDVFNYRRSWTIPTTLQIRDDATGTITTRPAAGTSVSVIAVYIDGNPQQGGIVALEIGATPIQIQ